MPALTERIHLFNQTFYIPPEELELVLDGVFSGNFIWQMFPWMEPFYFQFEKDFRASPHVEYFTPYYKYHEYLVFPLLSYAFTIFVLPRIMKDRPAFDLKWPLAMWNLALSIFSLMGMLRVWPYVFWLSARYTWKEVNCLQNDTLYGGADIALWLYMFILSKNLELYDTTFLVLRKKPVIFLHWWHHFTVLCYTYFATIYRNSGIHFAAMNYTVHFFMYGYFFLMAIKSVPKWFNPSWLTVMQILQMVVGVFIINCMIYYKTQGPCEGVKWEIIWFCLGMYASYLYLFVDFFFRRFFTSRAKKTKLSAAAKQD